MAQGPDAPVRNPAAVLFQITAIVIVGAAITLGRVEQSVTSPDFAGNPTPLGYTFSLALFLVPLVWLLDRRERSTSRARKARGSSR